MLKLKTTSQNSDPKILKETKES